MNAHIKISYEKKRGCGYRKQGGLYLVSMGPGMPCGRLPIPLDVCPCCGNGIKPSRGWTWVNGTALVAGHECASSRCDLCPLGSAAPGRVGLLWIGEQFYPRPDDWTREAQRMGVSRRIAAVPLDFELGETWIWVAHRRAITNADGSFTAGVFHCFKPQRIEVIVSGDEPDDEIERLVKRGLTPVKVIKESERAPLFEDQP